MPKKKDLERKIREKIKIKKEKEKREKEKRFKKIKNEENGGV